MKEYTYKFPRDPSNPNIISNKHFTKNLPPLAPKDDPNRTESDLIQKDSPIPAMTQHSKALEEDYQPAKYDRALRYKNSRSYCIRESDGSYRELQLLVEAKSLKYFGLGPYFYVQFMRRVTWLMFVGALLSGVVLFINSRSSGMSSYSSSFSTYLISTTLGNFNSNSISSFDSYIVALFPLVIFVFFYLFYLCWKCHFYAEIEDEENNISNIKPEKFCIQVEGLNPSEAFNQDNLRRVFSNFGPIHEISIVKRHKNKLQYFEKLQNMEQQIKQIDLQLRYQNIGNGNVDELNKLREQKQKLKDQLKGMSIIPKSISAYVHFEYEKSKLDCLDFFKNNYLYNTCSHSCVRNCCCCCLSDLEARYELEPNQKVLVKEVVVPAPEDINWESFELSFCSKFCRFIFAVFIIIIFLAISCAIIGLCAIYISTHSSNCDSVVIPTSLATAQASTDPAVKTCYCNANLLASLTDSSIQSYCSSELTSIYVEQGIQYAIILTSAATNFLFGFVVDKIVNCTRPASQSQSLKVKTFIYTIFLILNTILLPIFLYSDIFGFKTASYFSFITVMSSGFGNFLDVKNLQLYLDYSQIWYRNVSPIFTNYLIFDILGVWLMFMVSKCQARHSTLSEKENLILQKRMNSEITSFQFSPYKEYSAFLMITFMTLFLASGIPVLLPLAWGNLASRYITNRSLIQYSSARVDGLGVSFNQLPHSFLPIFLMASCVNCGWMLTANSQIYPTTLPFNATFGDVNSWIIMQRELYLPFYIFMAILIAVEFILFQMLIRFCACICPSCAEKKRAAIPSHTKTFTEHKRTMNILTSYKIQSNDKMRNIITRMEMYMSKQAQ